MAKSMRVVKEGLYEHYKGQQYRVFFPATHSETEERVVVYQALYGDYGYWVRPLEMFMSSVTKNGQKTPRFKYVGPFE